MVPLPFSLALGAVALIPTSISAASPGAFEVVGSTQVSAMMLFLGNEEKVYILDKAEMNSAQINGHPAWGAIWDITSRRTTLMDVRTNTFCSSGMHLPNGSFVTFGGNGAVGPHGSLGSQLNPGNYSGAWDSTIQDFDGARSIRILNPCRNSDPFNSSNCQWYDDPSVLSMQKRRWYSAAEATGEGRVVIIGGFVNGGYVNRNYPNVDPAHQAGAAEPTYEYYPPSGAPLQNFTFLIQTSGLNAYAHTFLMPSGKMFVQANLSTILWEHSTNQETQLPAMPNGVARIYPASGATAMLPLTPGNNYTPTILFCGGSSMSEYSYGNYTFPYIDTWDYPASKDCRRITPEPQDGSSPVYVADDDMPEGRTMGQFIILPTGKLLVVNGGLNGTAGFSQSTLTTPSFAAMPFGESLASGPILTPAIYDPDAPQGSRWSVAGLSASNIPRLYHSSAILLPDASVFIAGSNPNIDVNLTTIYPTTYTAEIFYPPYFNATPRPVPVGMPKTLTYGGDYFDIHVPASSYTGSAIDAANSASVVIVRPGFTTHAMNMGQRHMQLNSTYTVNSNGSITLHVSQPPPNPNLFQPGPALMFVNILGIPSRGSYLLVGNGQIGPQPTQAVARLPGKVQLPSATGSAQPADDKNNRPNATGIIVGVAIGCLAFVAMIGVIIGLIHNRRGRKRKEKSGRRSRQPISHPKKPRPRIHPATGSDSETFIPLRPPEDYSHTLTTPFIDSETYGNTVEPFPRQDFQIAESDFSGRRFRQYNEGHFDLVPAGARDAFQNLLVQGRGPPGQSVL